MSAAKERRRGYGRRGTDTFRAEQEMKRMTGQLSEPSCGLREVLDKVHDRACRALSESHKEDTRAIVEICDIVEAATFPGKLESVTKLAATPKPPVSAVEWKGSWICRECHGIYPNRLDRCPACGWKLRLPNERRSTRPEEKKRE